jgi:lysyl-tRNA synthetase class 2
MSIITEKIEGKVISVTINSSNIRGASYNSENETLTIEFTSGSIYEYYKVPWNIFTKFRLSESQGKFFNASISKTYKYAKKP